MIKKNYCLFEQSTSKCQNCDGDVITQIIEYWDRIQVSEAVWLFYGYLSQMGPFQQKKSIVIQEVVYWRSAWDFGGSHGEEKYLMMPLFESLGALGGQPSAMQIPCGFLDSLEEHMTPPPGMSHCLMRAWVLWILVWTIKSDPIQIPIIHLHTGGCHMITENNKNIIGG